MQELVISERTLESAFLLFAASFCVCLFVFFEALHLSLAPSAALISPPLHFLHRLCRFLSSAHYRPTLRSSLVQSLSPCRQSWLWILLPINPSTHPSTPPLNPRPKGSDPLLPKLTPSELKKTHTHTLHMHCNF